jgi:hypothetical protein
MLCAEMDQYGVCAVQNSDSYSALCHRDFNSEYTFKVATNLSLEEIKAVA